MHKLLLISLLTTFLTFSQETEWIVLQSMPESAPARHHPVTFSANGYGYVLGGVSPNDQFLADFYRYDPITGEWEDLGDYPGPGRGFGYGVEYKGKVYVGTGIVVINGQTFLGNDLWEYDPSLNEWTQLSPMPESAGRFHPAFVAASDKIFVGAGAGNGVNLNDWWEYNIETDVWRQLPDFPSHERHHPYHFMINEEPYVGCGHGTTNVLSTSTGDVTNIYTDWFKWDVENEQWVEVANFPGEGRVAGTQFSYNGKGYMLSGEGEDHDIMEEGEFWEYDPSIDEWTQLDASHPGLSRWAPGSFIIEDGLYFTGGRTNRRTDPNYRLEKDLWFYQLPELLSIRENNIDIDIKVFPNPASEFINIDANSRIDMVNIYNSEGNIVLEIKNNYTNINIKELTQGKYFIEVFIDGETINKSFVKLN